MSPSGVPDPDLLLRHASFVRALACRLSADENAADDLVQDTWLAVLERPLASVRSPRQWLAGVLSNLWRERARGEDRRRRREERAAREEALPPATDMLEAAASGRELVDFVLDLEEPFRTTVLLRYYENLPPRAIAERLGVPVKTVNSRLSRGLDRLRARWKREHGEDAETWLASLVAIARPRVSSSALPPASAGASPLSTLSIGALVMSTKGIALGLFALTCGVLTVLWTRSSPEEERAPVPEVFAERPIERSAALSTPAASGAGLPTEHRARAGATDPGGLPPSATEAREKPRVIHGRVLNAEALPLAGVEVVYRPAESSPIEARTRSAAGGIFELEARITGAGIVTVEDPNLVTLFYGSVRANTAIEPLVVVAPFRDLGGRVVDELGRGLTGARVRLALPRGFAARFDAAFDATEGREWNAETNAEGRFELARAPVVEESQIVAALDMHAENGVAAPPVADLGIEIVLAHASADGPGLRGRVEDPAGKPVARAHVTLGARTTSTDEQGNFALSLKDAEDASEVVALARGYLPGRVRADRDPVSGAALWPDFVTLRLGGPPLVLDGEVVNRAGQPRAGLRVWIADPTPFGILRDETKAQVEYLLASQEPIGSEAELGRANWSSEETDARGRFRIEGLLPRAYSVRVLDPKTLGASTFGPFEARAVEPRAGEGEREKIVFDEGPPRRIAGRIVSRGGHPVENVRLELWGAEFGGVWENGGSALTAADGRFAFDGIGQNAIALWIRGDEVVSEFRPVSETDAKSDMEITVSVRCHFKVDCGTSVDLADTIRMLDEKGAPVTMTDVAASGETRGASFPLVEGRSKTLAVTTDARTLVLSKHGQEVRRVPLDLVSGRLNLIQP